MTGSLVCLAYEDGLIYVSCLARGYVSYALISDQTYANILLGHAKQLFEFATQFKGKYSDSVPAAAAYYRSEN